MSFNGKDCLAPSTMPSAVAVTRTSRGSSQANARTTNSPLFMPGLLPAMAGPISSRKNGPANTTGAAVRHNEAANPRPRMDDRLSSIGDSLRLLDAPPRDFFQRPVRKDRPYHAAVGAA